VLVRNPKEHCRLLYIVGRMDRGGLERQLFYLLRGIDRDRYRPAVLVWDYHDEDRYIPQLRTLGIPIYSFPILASGLAKLRALHELVRAIRPELIHSYSFYTNFAAYWAARSTHAIGLGSVRSNFSLDKKNSGPCLGRLSARWPRHQIFNSIAAIDTARNSGGYFVPKKPYLVRNGLDLEIFEWVPLVTEGTPQVVGLGYLLPVKRWDRLLLAALDLKRKGLDYLLHIAGDGPLRNTLEKQAEDLGMTDRVKFIGHIDDVGKILATATFLVHTSDNEGCPNAVMEAMACGRAVIATEVGDVPYLVEEGKTGFVVRRGDIERLIDRMATLVSDRELCRRMGQAGRAKAEREFGLDRLVEQTFNVYMLAGWKDLGPR